MKKALKHFNVQTAVLMALFLILTVYLLSPAFAGDQAKEQISFKYANSCTFGLL